MLTVSGLTTHYGSSQALFGVDLEVGAGKVATLTCRNGMGKTTTINSIMGIVPPSGGSILFGGTELVGKPSFKTANLGIGLVPEGTPRAAEGRRPYHRGPGHERGGAWGRQTRRTYGLLSPFQA